jgi:hypothetical protein
MALLIFVPTLAGAPYVVKCLGCQASFDVSAAVIEAASCPHCFPVEKDLPVRTRNSPYLDIGDDDDGDPA